MHRLESHQSDTPTNYETQIFDRPVESFLLQDSSEYVVSIYFTRADDPPLFKDFE